MTSRSKQMERKYRAGRRAEEGRAKKAAAAGAAAEAKVPTAIHDKTGLEWLEDKGRLTKPQIRMGKRYGEAWRTSRVESAVLLTSCLNDEGGGGMPSRRAKPGKISAEMSAAITDAKVRLARYDAALGYDSGLIAVCSLICGMQRTPGEIVRSQNAITQIERELRKALDRLIADEATAGRDRRAS